MQKYTAEERINERDDILAESFHIEIQREN